jgi:lysophospholipase L1-like esterase
MHLHRAFLLLLALAGAPLLPSARAAEWDLPASDEGLPGEGPLRRYEWFQKLWNGKRAAWAQRVEADRGAVVLLGDSITQGWGDDFSLHFPGLKIANRGISGDTSRGMLIRLPGDVLALRPKAVVLLLGTNDIEEKASPEVVAANLKRILAALQAHDPQMPVVLNLVFPSSAKKSRPKDTLRKLNSLLAAEAKGNPQVTVIDTWTLFADPEGDAQPARFPDLLHLNAEGYATWAAALRPIFATLGFLETEPDAFTPEAGFESLFNGRDLTGWGYPGTPFDGRTSSADHRYRALAGRLVVATPPEGRKLTQLWTTREFPGNFTLRLEFRAGPNADSGVFIRKPQLQCRDYPLAGPYKHLTRYRPLDWNELEVVVKDGVARCTCNGEVLEAALAVPPTGPIGLEGDRGQMEYRRLRLRADP